MMSFSDFQEIYEARRSEFIAGNSSVADFKSFLARNGYNATAIEQEVQYALADAAHKWFEEHPPETPFGRHPHQNKGT